MNKLLFYTALACGLGASTNAQNVTVSRMYTNTFFGKFNVKIDAFNDTKGKPTLRYDVELPTNTYIGFGYKYGMIGGVDMVAFMAGTDNARVGDLWSLSENTPAFDAQ